MSSCRNCGFPVDDKFCSHCGQKFSSARITLGYIWKEIFHFFSHMERGFLFTSIQLIISPGRTVLDFIEGKRRNYQTPVSYFLIWITIFTLFLYVLEKLFGDGRIINYNDYFGKGSMTKMALSHLGLIIMVVLPFQALYLYLLITKYRYNYMESLVMVIYMVGTIILFQFVFVLLSLVIYPFSREAIDLQYSDIFKAAYSSWFITDLVRILTIRRKFLKILLYLFLAFGTFTVWRVYLYPWLSGYLRTVN